MSGTASDPAYWEAFAQDLGWAPEKVREAGRVGSQAVSRGMKPAEAVDVVIARVRDGREVRIGPGRLMGLIRNNGFLSFLAGLIALLAVGLGEPGQLSVRASFYAVLARTAFIGVMAIQVFLVVRGLTRRGWGLTVLGVILTAAALALLVGVPPR